MSKTKSKTSGIYFIKNKANDKVYIGQSINIEIRTREELKGRSINNFFVEDLKFYGADKFSISILEEIDKHDKDRLNEREKYYINYYNSMDRDIGYNILPGGTDCCLKFDYKEDLYSKRIFQLLQKKVICKETGIIYANVLEAEKDVGMWVYRSIYKTRTFLKYNFEFI